MRPGLVILALWAAWALSWVAAAFWSARTEKRVALRSELANRIPTVVGALIFFVPAHGYEGPLRLWHAGATGAWICTALTAAGFAFAWWARIALGRLWSGHITRKEGHTVVDHGPYGIVRHPIYTGILFSVYATMGAKGTVLAIVGAALMTLGFWMKAKVEEAWLSRELGEAAYADYRRRVPMLVPFGPR